MGESCQYQGDYHHHQALGDEVAGKDVIAVCPEVLAGLPTPREPVEWRDGRVVDVAGNCYDELFEKGIKPCLDEMAGKSIDLAILQSRSPSCGVNQVDDGNFSGQKGSGSGRFAQKLKELGYHVVDVEEIKQLEGK